MSQFEQEKTIEHDDEQKRIALEQKLKEVEESYEHKVNFIKDLEQENRDIREECKQNRNRINNLEEENKDIQEKYEQLSMYVQKLEKENEEVKNKYEASIDHLKQEKEEIPCVGVASEQQKLIHQYEVEKDELKL